MKEEVTAYRKQQKEWGFLIVSGYFRLWVGEWVWTQNRLHLDTKNPRKQAVYGDFLELVTRLERATC